MRRATDRKSPPTPPPRADIDQRTAERLPVTLPLTYTIHDPSGPVEGSTVTSNLSGTGVGFRIPQPVAPASPCRLRLTLPQRTDPLHFTGRVAWCRKIPHDPSTPPPLAGSLRISPSGLHSPQTFEVQVGLALSMPADAREEPSFATYCHFIASELVKRYLG
jgi:hypothetical protein